MSSISESKVGLKFGQINIVERQPHFAVQSQRPLLEDCGFQSKLRNQDHSAVAALLNCYRDAILWGSSPDPRALAYLVVVALLSVVIGHAIFARGEGKFAKYI